MTNHSSRSQGRPIYVWLIGVIVVLLAVGGVAYWLTRADEQPTTPTAPPELNGVQLNSGVLGDEDGDGELTDAENAALATAQENMQTFRRLAVPSTTKLATMLTPAGGEWWSLVTSEAAELQLTGTPMPPGATWYGFAEVEAARPLDPTRTAYPAIYAQLPDFEAGIDWVEELGASYYGDWRGTVRGDGLVTLNPTWVDLLTEPVVGAEQTPQAAKQLAPLTELAPQLGYWVKNISADVRAQAAASVSPTAVRAVWDSLGLGGDGVSWAGTSTRPDAIWRGKVTGFDAAAVAVIDGVVAINSADECKGCEDARSMRVATYDYWAAQPDGNQAGNIDLQVKFTEQLLADVDPSVYLLYEPSFDADLLGRGLRLYSAVQRTHLWVVDDQLYLFPQFD